MKKIVALLLLVIVTLAGIAGYLAIDFVNARPSGSAEEKIFDLEPGMSFKVVARKLEAEGLVTSAAKFTFYARIVGGAGKVRVGEYAIAKNASPKEVLQAIVSGKSIERAVTIAEGLNMYDVGETVERLGVGSRKDFLTLAQDKLFVRELLREPRESLEGYLFPETYRITKFTGLKGLIRLMVARFFETYKQIQMAPDVHLSRHELVTLASIVEKETGAPEERSVIASVFHNRLRLGMKMQTDPTVLYGMLDLRHASVKNITRADLLTDTRYNTYVRVGLPFGPISNPGREALQATAKPATTEFLYFVSQNNGTHVFSRDYGAHQKAVSTYQLNKNVRESATWRDLRARSKDSAAAHAAELAQPVHAKGAKPNR